MSTTSQVIVNVDTKLKNLAMKKAKGLGMPFSAVINSVIRAFVDGEVSVGLTEEFNAKTSRQIKKALADFKAGKNISPPLRTIAQVREYLDN